MARKKEGVYFMRSFINYLLTITLFIAVIVTIAIFTVDLKSSISVPYPQSLRFVLISSEIMFPSLNLTTRLQYSAMSGS